MKVLVEAGFAAGLILFTILLISGFIILFSFSSQSSSYKVGNMHQDSTLLVNAAIIE